MILNPAGFGKPARFYSISTHSQIILHKKNIKNKLK
jgi:hypothetical protein